MRELQSLGIDIAVYTDEARVDLMQDVSPRRSTLAVHLRILSVADCDDD